MNTSYFRISCFFFSLFSFMAHSQFVHQPNEAAFVAMLRAVKEKMPQNLRGYRSETVISGRSEAVGNFQRNSTLDIDLASKTLTLKVVEAPQKGAALKKSGTLAVKAYLVDGKVWVEQRFLRDPVADWKLPLNYEAGSFVGDAEQFQYFDNTPQSKSKRQSDFNYSLRLRLFESGFSETAKTQYKFLFSANLDDENPSLVLERLATGLSTGEKDDNGADLLKSAALRLSVSKNPTKGYED